MNKAVASLLSFLASLYCLFIVDMVRYECAAKHLCMLGPACPLQKAYVNGVEDPNRSWKHMCKHCKGLMHGGACGQLLADALESLSLSPLSLPLSLSPLSLFLSLTSPSFPIHYVIGTSQL